MNIQNDQAIQLLNLLNRTEDKKIISDLETQVSDLFKAALVQKSLPEPFLETVAYYKKNLARPIQLNLSGTDVEDKALALLIGLPIHSLLLQNCQKLTQNCLPIFSQMPALKTLNLGSNKWVDDQIQIPSNIETLSLAACRNIGKVGIVNLQFVRALDLFGSRLSDGELAHLPDLEALDLSMCKGVGEMTMKRLGEMKKLRHLVITSIPVTDELVAYLPKQLETLNASGCPLSDVAFKTFAKMDHLKSLTLGGAQIKGEGLPSLSQSLVLLNLSGCSELTDQWLVPLATRTQLRALSLHRCPKISSKAIDRFSDTQIKVEWQEAQPSHLAMKAFK